MATWEQCVREVTLSADPETVGSVGAGWNNLATALGYLRDSLVGRSFVGPIAPGKERPHVGGLPGMLADWRGSGGDAYREHLGDIGKDIEELITYASNVSGALTRIEGDIRKAVASIPIPLMDDFGWNEWSLPNGTELDDARDGESASGFLAALRKDYQSNPASYADGAFRDKADDLEATMKVDGQANDHKRGGWWDTKSHLDNWYNDNQKAANSAMSPLPTAVETERPRLIVPAATDPSDGYKPDDRKPPAGYPGGGGGVGGGGGFGGGGPSLGSTGIDGGGGSYSGGSPSIATPPTGGGFGGGAGTSTPPSTGSGYPGTGTPDYGTGLAGAGGPTTIGSGYGGPNLTSSPGLGGGSAFSGGGPGLSSAGGPGGGGVGAAGGIGVGGIPGMVGGGNGKVPPMTSAASALRNAAGAGAGAGGARGGAAGLRGGAGMMGGGMLGGHGAGGHGSGATDHSSWLTEDDDPWGADDGASPGILR